MNPIVHEMADDLAGSGQLPARPWDDQVLPHHDEHHDEKHEGADKAAATHGGEVSQVAGVEQEVHQVAEAEQVVRPSQDSEKVMLPSAAEEEVAHQSAEAEQAIYSSPAEDEEFLSSLFEGDEVDPIIAEEQVVHKSPADDEEFPLSEEEDELADPVSVAEQVVHPSTEEQAAFAPTSEDDEVELLAVEVEQLVHPSPTVEQAGNHAPAVGHVDHPAPIADQAFQVAPVVVQAVQPAPAVEQEIDPESVVEQLVQQASVEEPMVQARMSPVEALSSDAGGAAEQGKAEDAGKGKASLAAFGSANSRHGFRIGILQLMIRHEDSSQIAEIEAIHRLPNAPSWFRGVTNLHGKLTPVFDLAPYMGLRHGSGQQMLLVLDHGTDATGIIIDGLLERLHLPVEEDSNLDAAPMRLTPHLRGASMVDGKVWYDLDMRSLLSELEQSVRSG